MARPPRRGPALRGCAARPPAPVHRKCRLPARASPSEEKKARLARMSYADFLTNVAGCDKDVLPFLQSVAAQSLTASASTPYPRRTPGVWATPASRGWVSTPTPGPGMNLDAVPYDAPAVLLPLPRRQRHPGAPARATARFRAAIPGSTADDIVTARADYGRLDETGSDVRLRLDSTVVRVRHVGEPATASAVEVAYVRDGRLETVRGRRVVLACWNSVIPHLLPGPARGAEGGPRVRGEGADRVHERASPRLEGVREGGRPRDRQPRQLPDRRQPERCP